NTAAKFHASRRSPREPERQCVRENDWPAGADQSVNYRIQANGRSRLKEVKRAEPANVAATFGSARENERALRRTGQRDGSWSPCQSVCRLFTRSLPSQWRRSCGLALPGRGPRQGLRVGAVSGLINEWKGDGESWWFAPCWWWRLS